MQEIFDDLIDYLKGIWIKRRYIIISTWLICPIGWGVVAMMPDIYQSKARIYADTQSILAPLLKGLTVQTNPDIQINLMVKTLLSRPNLERISRMTDMDIQAENPQQYEGVISRLRDNIKIKKQGRRDNIFTISFEDTNPEMAKNVVQSALTVFIENTLGENRTDADSAQKFLKSQIAEYENRLANSESRLTDFKQKYSNMLPDQYGGYYNKLNITKEQLQVIELSLLESETQLKSAKAQLKTVPTQSTNSQNKIQTSNSIKTSYDDRIAELELSLDSLQLRYTDKHPDVAEAKRRLVHLEKQRTKEINDYLNITSSKDGSTLITSQNPVIQQLQIQVNQFENMVASIKVRANDYRTRVKELENKIHVLPEIEAELVALNRGYEITKNKYEQLLNRQETAQLAQQADQTTNKIQFKVIDPPRAATKPSGPKRILFFILVTFVGLGAGIGLSLLLSQLSPVATSTSQLSKATGVPVFGVVSANQNLGLQKWHRKKTIIFVISNLSLLVIFIMFMSYFLFPDAIQAPLKRIF
ncbi:MAG: chain length determinant family protein [Colwellia sp.]|jgi:polysaccharide chain length determinant protein (PEP-CTERM system associated)|nr:MAG: chain length determinant family protein [Colwellia sp.]